MACLDLEGRDVLVVGAGSVALEKIEGLLEVVAGVTVVAPAVSEPVEALARAETARPGQLCVVAQWPEVGNSVPIYASVAPARLK